MSKANSVFARLHTLLVRGTFDPKGKHKELTSGEFFGFKRTDPGFPYTKYEDVNEKSPVIKTRESFWNAMVSLFAGEAAVGLTKKGTSISEYTNSSGITEFCVYSKTDGCVSALRYLGDGKSEEYKLLGRMSSSNEDCSLGEVIILSLLPEALSEEEFKEHFEKAKEMFSKLTDKSTSEEKIAFQAELCWMQSNFAWRVSASELKCSLNVSFLEEWNNEMSDCHVVPKIKDVSKCRATSVVAGTFNVLEPATEDNTNSNESSSDANSFNGMYNFGTDQTGVKDVPILGKEIIIPQEAHIVCSHAKAMDAFRNFLFRGEAGSGKSMLAKIIAAGVAKFHGIFTCCTNTEIFDLLGQVLPVLTKAGEMTEEEKKLVSDVIDIGGFSQKNISEILNLPSLEDVFFDPDGVYEALNGKTKSGVRTEEVVTLWENQMKKQLERVMLAISKGSSEGGAPKYTYTETPFLRAIRDGGVVELQEPNVIAQPGVMVGLNGVMEHGGSVVLPTGERIWRHPDSIVIVTTNVSYEGCRDMNASLLDRMDMAFDINTPSVAVMVERTKAQTGFEDEKALTEMAQIVKDINAIMKEQGISDGTSGDRSLMSWALSAKLTGDIYTSALYTLLPKCTANEEDRALLQKRLNTSSFASKRKKRI